MLRYCALVVLFTFSAFVMAAGPSLAQDGEPETPFSSETIHIGVVVSDLEASMKFYMEAIGMQHVSGFDIGADLGKDLGLSDGIAFRVEVLQLGTDEDATQWKLMTFGDRAEGQENSFIHDRVGMQYITVYVRDLNDAVMRLDAADIPMLGQTPAPIPDDNYFVLVQDPDGNFVEIIGPMP